MNARILHLPKTRQWDVAKSGPLTADWSPSSPPIDSDIRYALRTIRARCRNLAQNSDHAKGFLRIVRNNVVGPQGYVLQSRAVTVGGKPDQRARDTYEGEWKAWGKRGNCDVTGKFSWNGICRHVIETVARDGECFIRILRPWANKWGVALQIVDADAVDALYVGEYQGREVRMGVELDEWRKPVAYHLLSEPTLNQSSYNANGDRVRIPAEEMLHVFLPEFSHQTRGIPWLAVAAGRLRMIQGTEDAELTASRASAAKFAAYEAHEWAPPEFQPDPSLVDQYGKQISSDPGAFQQEIAPGAMEIVPRGYSLKMIDPQHPNANMGGFLKWGLRSVATGMGVSYNTLGNDAEGVNYTSLRFFLGVERDNWMEMQEWFMDEFPEPVRQAWTDDQVAYGTLVSRPGREYQWDNVYWQPRRWDGPDPAKQADADQKELEMGATTLHRVLARKGEDFDDTMNERVQELAAIKAAAVAAGLTLEEVLPYISKSIAPNPGVQDD
jgi:lambda family phage portal protein